MKHLALFLTFFVSIIFSLNCFGAAKISRIKGRNLLISLNGKNVKTGELYYLVVDGKKKGIIRILKRRPGQALGRLLKGKAGKGWRLVRRVPRKTKIVNVRRPKPRKKKIVPEGRFGIGGIVGLSFQNNAEVSFSSPSRVAQLEGSSNSFEILADYQIRGGFWLRSSIGLQEFSAEEDGALGCLENPADPFSAADCAIDLSYVNVDFWARYVFETGRFHPWIGGGIGFLLSPSFGDTNAINEEDVGTTTFFQVGAGFDFYATPKFYIPIWIEYGLYPDSETVSLNSLSVKAGFGIKL